MRALLVLCLACAVLRAAPTSPQDLGAAFLDGFRSGDEVKMKILAARRPRDVAYTLVVYWLLGRGEREAAQKLIEFRQGPERPGLELLFKTLDGGLMPAQAQVDSLDRARKEWRANRRDEATKALGEAGEPLEGTVLGAQIYWLRAKLSADPAEFRDACTGCIRIARGIGWFALVRKAAWLAVQRLAPESKAALDAAEALVAAVGPRGLDLRGETVDALLRRGELLIRHDKVKQGRLDWVNAANLAKRDRDRFREARAWSRLALHWDTEMRSPRRALKFYGRALAAMQGLTKQGPALLLYRRLLHNTAVVQTSLVLYDPALASLAELERSGELPPELERRMAHQRAYLYRRQGRVVDALAAYEQVCAARDPGSPKWFSTIGIEAAETLFLAGAFPEAEARFDAVLKREPGNLAARLGRGAVRAVRGRYDEAQADYRVAAEAAEEGTVAYPLVLLKRAASERVAGRIPEARVSAAKALRLLLEFAKKEDDSRIDYGNTAVAYLLLGDLLLLERHYQEAVGIIERGAVFFYKLKDASRAVPGYARWALTLMALNEPDLALRRLGFLRGMAQNVTDPTLKGISANTDAVFELKAGRPAEARLLFGKAIGFADEAHNLDLGATARTHLALADPGRAQERVDKALALLAAERIEGPQDRPFLEGEQAGFAASIGVKALLDAGDPDPARAFSLIERARLDRLIVALGGRAPILDGEKSYVAARAALMQARATRKAVPAAEAAFDAMVRQLDPALRQLAFPTVPALEEVQGALGANTALLLMLDDPYARRVMVAVSDSRAAVVAAFDPGAPLEAVREIVAGRTRLLVAPDGLLSIDPTRWGKRKAAEKFDICYVPSASWWLFGRGLKRSGEGAARVGPGPIRLGEPGQDRLQLLHIGTPALLRLSHPRVGRVASADADAVFLAGLTLDHGRLPSTDALSALAARRLATGTRQMIVSLVGPPPPEFWTKYYDALLGRGMAPATALRATRQAVGGDLARQAAGIVVWGVP